MKIFDDTYFMRMALQEARAAFEEGEIPIGAVIVSDCRIVAKAHNLTEALRDVTAHAEMQAITSASTALGGKYLTDCTIYVTVEPCPMCAAALGWSQIGRIVYGASDSKKGYFSRIHHHASVIHPKTAVTPGVMAEEAAALMKDFFKKLRR